MAKIPYVDLTDTVNTHRLRTNQIIDSVGDLSLLSTDSNTTLVDAINSVDSNQGDRANLNTKHGADLVDAINSALEMLDSDLGKPFSSLNTKEKATVIDAINSALAMHESDMGDLSTLNTKEKATVVDAINSALAMHESDMGLLSSLTTKEKGTIVDAINSVQDERDSDLGDLTNLNTDAKSTIVAAINSLVVNRGVMTDLVTVDSSNLVGAINELKFRVDLLDSDTGILLDSTFEAIVKGDSASRRYALNLIDSQRSYLIDRIVSGDSAVQANLDSDVAVLIARDESDRTDLLNRLSAGDSTLRALIDSNSDNFQYNVRREFLGGTGIVYDSATGVIKLENVYSDSSPVGSSTEVPVITIDSQGRIISTSTATVAGIDSVDFNDSTGVLRISTADGAVYSNVIGLGAATTDGLREGDDNLYYTQQRTDSDIVNKVIKSYVDNLGIDAETLGGRDSTYLLAYANLDSVPTIGDGRIVFHTDRFLQIDSSANVRPLSPNRDSADFTLNQTADREIVISHPLSTLAGGTYGQDGTEDGKYVKSVTTDHRGHLTAITTDDFDNRYDNYVQWKIRGDGASSADIKKDRVIQFEGGNYVSTTLDTSGTPWKLTIAVNTNVGGQLLLKNSAGTTLKTILGITTSV